MYVLAVMENWELERLRKNGNKQRYLAVYFSAPNMPLNVARLYVAFLGDKTTQGYFEVHDQFGNTVAMWSESFVEEKISVTNFSHIVGLEPLVSKFITQVKRAKEAIKKTKQKRVETDETSESRLRARKARKERNTARHKSKS